MIFLQEGPKIEDTPLKLHDPNFNRFWLMHPCDGQTERQTDGRTDGRMGDCI